MVRRTYGCFGFLVVGPVLHILQRKVGWDDSTSVPRLMVWLGFEPRLPRGEKAEVAGPSKQSHPESRQA